MWRRLGLSLLALLALVVGVTLWQAGRREAATEAANPPLGGFVTVAGREVHYLQMGTGPDLVILHGAGGNIRDFTMDFAQRLTDRYRVTLFDRPGHGYTPAAPALRGALARGGESPEAQARLLQGAAAKLGVTAPLVMGHSFGGAVAMAWATYLPETLAGVVNVSGVSNPWPGELNWTYKLNGSALGGLLAVPALAAFLPRAKSEEIAAGIFTTQDMPAAYPEAAAIALSTRRVTLRANARQVLNLRPHVVVQSARYGGITVPLEIVHGDADTIVPLAVHSEPLSRQVPGANLTVLDGIGHMPHFVRPEAVIAAIDRAAARADLR